MYISKRKEELWNPVWPLHPGVTVFDCVAGILVSVKNRADQKINKLKESYDHLVQRATELQERNDKLVIPELLHIMKGLDLDRKKRMLSFGSLRSMYGHRDNYSNKEIHVNTFIYMRSLGW